MDALEQCLSIVDAGLEFTVIPPHGLVRAEMTDMNNQIYFK